MQYPWVGAASDPSRNVFCQVLRGLLKAMLSVSQDKDAGSLRSKQGAEGGSNQETPSTDDSSSTSHPDAEQPTQRGPHDPDQTYEDGSVLFSAETLSKGSYDKLH